MLMPFGLLNPKEFSRIRHSNLLIMADDNNLPAEVSTQ
jgi:hypothetical protein